MSSSAEKLEPGNRAVRVWFEEAFICVQLSDGREVKTPIEFYPTLARATAEELATFEIFGQGTAIHWPGLDEDLPVEGIVLGRKGLDWNRK
jgi:hypothetical protein